MSMSVEMEAFQMFSDGMEGADLRHEATADNIANVNTPGYKRKEVYFEEKLQEKYMQEEGFDPVEGPQKLAEGNDASSVQPVMNRVEDTSIRNDKNNVDPDKAMVKSSKNTLYFNGLTGMANHQFSMITDLVNNLSQV